VLLQVSIVAVKTINENLISPCFILYSPCSMLYFPCSTFIHFSNRFLPHIRPLQGIGPYSLSQCIEDLLGDWEELKAHYDENNQSSPLRRTDVSVNVNVSMNLDQNQTPKLSLKHEGMDRETSEYLDKGTKLLTRMSF